MCSLNEAEVTFPTLHSCQLMDIGKRITDGEAKEGGRQGIRKRDVINSSQQKQTSEVSCQPSRLVPTTSKYGVPLVFHEPHMERGFRVLGQPWTYYFWSIFQLHNETVNVWTHLLAFILMAAKMISFSSQIDFINDPYTWPLLSGLFCGMALYACSSGAHCLQSRSELVHYTAFMFDYAGIGLYGLGSVIMHLEYCSEKKFYDSVQSFFVPLGCLLAFLICFCCSISKTIYKRPYPFIRKIWQIVPVGGIYLLLISPIVHRLFRCYAFDYECNDSISYHVQQMIWFASSGFFFTCEFPQKLKPGLCDHFFHSHQIFHISIMICTLKQMDAVFIDFQTRTSIILMRPMPTFLSAFVPVIVVCLAELVCIYVFRGVTKKRLIAQKVSELPNRSQN